MLASIFIFRTIVTSWFRHRESHLTQKNIRSSTFKTNDDNQTQLPPWSKTTVEYHMPQTCTFQTSIPDVDSRREPQSGVRKSLSWSPLCSHSFCAKLSHDIKTYLIPSYFTISNDDSPWRICSRHWCVINALQYTIYHTPTYQWPVHLYTLRHIPWR